MGHAKKRGTYEERVAQSEKGIKSYEQFLESKVISKSEETINKVVVDYVKQYQPKVKKEDK
jgi:hypothetical protein